MNIRRMILLAAGALLASRAGAQGSSGSSPPPSDQKSMVQQGEDKAKELGQQGEDAAKQGTESAQKKANEAGQAATAKVVGTKTVTGKIADISQDQVNVDAAGTPVNMHVTGSTQVTIDGEKSSLDSLKQGDQVRASFTHSGGESTATKLEVKRNATTFPKPSSTPQQGTGSTSDTQ